MDETKERLAKLEQRVDHLTDNQGRFWKVLDKLETDLSAISQNLLVIKYAAIAFGFGFLLSEMGLFEFLKEFLRFGLK